MGGSSNAGSIANTIKGIQISTSCYDQPIPIVYGTARLAGNIIWMPAELWKRYATSSGGKGGSSTPGERYTQAAMIALCEGPILGIGRVWRDKDLFQDLASAEPSAPMSLSLGSRPQTPWSWLTTPHKMTVKRDFTIPNSAPYTIDLAATDPRATGVVYVQTAGGGGRSGPGRRFTKTTVVLLTNTYMVSGTVLTFHSTNHGTPLQITYEIMNDYTNVYGLGYSGTATVQSSAFDLGSSNAMKNYTFEVFGLYSESGGASPADVVDDFMTDTSYGCQSPADLIDVEYGQDGTAASGYRRYCEQMGFTISPIFEEQKPALEHMDDVMVATNSEMLWTGSKLRIIPLGDRDVGTYTAVTTVRASLTTADFKPPPGADPISVECVSVADTFNRVPVEFIEPDTTDEASAYNVSVVDVPLESDVVRTGERKAAARSLHMITNRAHAQKISSILAQKSCYVTTKYFFRLGWEHVALEPLDIVQLTDEEFGLDHEPVRIRSIEEDDDGYLSVEAEIWPLGVATATTTPTETGAGGGQDTQVDPLEAEPPIIFCPRPADVGNPELWIGTSGGPNWGGAQVWLSWDGGTSYSYAGDILRGVTGAAVTALPAGLPVDSQTVDVDVRGSLGVLESVTDTERNALVTASWLGQEIIAYTTATLQGDGSYRLGGGIKRGCYGTPVMSHAIGEQFMLLSSTMLRVPLSWSRYGTTVRVKFLSYNLARTALQQAENVVYYDYALPSSLTFQQIVGTPVKHTWESFSVDDWLTDGYSALTTVAGAGVNGGAALQADGSQSYFISKQKFPIDPTKRYRITVRLRQYSGDTEEHYISLGVAGYAADGATAIDRSGTALPSLQYTTPLNIAGMSSWTEVTVYMMGHAATGTIPGTYAAPGQFRTGVCYAAVELVLNMNNPGVTQVDSVEVAEADPVAVTAQTSADNAVTLAGTKTRAYYQEVEPSTGLSVGDLWYSTTYGAGAHVCPVSSCAGHLADTNGAPLVGSYAHRSPYWPHRWSGTAWTDAGGSQLIIASEIAAGAIVADKIAANALSSSDYAEDANGTPTAGARLRNVYASSSAWAANTAVTAGDVRTNAGRVYKCRTSGTTHPGTLPSAYSFSTTYASGNRVIYGSNTYVSLQNGNVARLPYTGKFGTDAWWRNEGYFEGPGYYTGPGIPDGTAVWDQVVPMSISPDGLQIGEASWNEAAIAGNIIYSGSFYYDSTTTLFEYSVGAGPIRARFVTATSTVLVEYPLPPGRTGAIGALFMSERYNSSGSASPKFWQLVRGMGTDPSPTQPAGWNYSFGQLVNSSLAVQTPANGYRMSLLVALF